jgi:hypothetical protein
MQCDSDLQIRRTDLIRMITIRGGKLEDLTARFSQPVKGRRLHFCSLDKADMHVELEEVR